MGKGLEIAKSCSIRYRTPGETDRSAMPIGNGRLAASVWTDRDGNINAYLSRGDALSELDRTLKLGKISVKFSPNPFTGEAFLQELRLQEGCICLSGKGGSCRIFIGDRDDTLYISGRFHLKTRITADFRTWRTVPASHNSDFFSDELTESADVVEKDCADTNIGNADMIAGSADTDAGGRILIFHKNGENLIRKTAENQSLADHMDVIPDFLTGRIFGGLMTGAGTYCSDRVEVRVYTESAQESEEDFRKHLQDMAESADHTENADHIEGADLIESADLSAADDFSRNAASATAAFAAVRQRWEKFWERSYVRVSGDIPVKPKVTPETAACAKEPTEYECDCTSPVTLAYNLTKYMLECCDGGPFPVLYNGFLFQMEPGGGKHFSVDNFGMAYTSQPAGEPDISCNPDERSWAREQMWQNLRHPYYTMLRTGSAEQVKVLFRYYRNFRELNRVRARLYYHAGGQHSTEMTLSCGLQSRDIYGKDRQNRALGYADNRWGGAVDISPGLEQLYLMLDCFAYEQGTLSSDPKIPADMPETAPFCPDAALYDCDSDSLQQDILIFAKDLFEYTATRFPNRCHGKMVIGPLQSVETYWNTIDPMPVVAGLHAVTERMLRLPGLSDDDRKYFQQYRSMLPAIPTRTKNGQQFFMPALAFDGIRHNVEPPEYYAVYPFDLPDMGLAGKTAARNTFEKYSREYGMLDPFTIGSRPDKASCCGWQYSGVTAARLGLTEVCRKVLENNSGLTNPGYRFPAMWGPVYDAVPDVDHGTGIMNLLHEMIVQTTDEEVRVLPAFPKDWKVEYRLYLQKDTVIEGDGNGYEYRHVDHD
jgi:hypothetical protein